MDPLRIVADENIPLVTETFSHLGEVACLPGRQLSNDHLKAADILLVRSVTPVNESLLEGTPVKFVGSTTIGFDHIDTDYLQRRGIQWANAPGCNANSVVDYVISALCRLDGAITQLLSGATVGIVGMGSVGSQLYRRLTALDIHCRAYDPLLDQQCYPILTDLDTVLASDVVCLHAPLTRSGPHPSFHLIDGERLQRLLPGTVLINAGRGAVMDSLSLNELLQQRDDLCVVLDVWENEPTINLELMKRVDFATPHIAGYSYDGKLAGTRMIYQSCCQFLRIEPQSVVSAPAVENPIEVRAGGDWVATVQDVVLSAYDIAADDQRLRGAMLHRPSDSTGKKFDRLRKNYPERREFNCYSVSNTDSMSEHTCRVLDGLGFRLC